MKKKNENVTEQIEANKPIDRKKLVPKIIAFVVFFALAVTFITIGVTRMGKKEEGLQEITAMSDEEMPQYELGVRFWHVFSGSSNEIKREVNVLNGVYTEDLKEVCRMLDPENTYVYGANLASLNQNLGREVSVPRELFDVLLDADAKTREGKGYNLYAGVFHAEWEDVRYLLDPAERDPLNDPEEAEVLSRLAEATADLSNFSLEVTDRAACTLRFTVSEEYLGLLRELEREDVPILDLNLLEEACKLQLLAARLEAEGYTCGYLSGSGGLTVALSAYEGGDYCLYGEQDGAAVPAATIPVQAGSCGAMLRAFGQADEAGFYVLEEAGETLLRHPWLPSDGIWRNVLLSAFVYSENLSPADLCFAALQLYAQETADEVQACAKALSGCSAALILAEEPAVVYITDPAFVPENEYGYAAREIR